MSSTPVQDPAAQGLSSGSGQTLPFRPLQPTSDPLASKRVCFYKSGDYKFSGHRMVINTRTFKTFDALLDALSKKVPLPFGVRTITTPRGTHLVRGLDDLQDGGSYVCSDQKRVKPLNMDEVNSRQVPWNTTRPPSASRRKLQGSQFGQFGRRNEIRAAKITERVAVRTPKKLVVIKNRDPTVKRTIVLQRRTAPTFDSLLDYLSQILQFPVLKLYSTDGRRVDGLAALILCSGVVVAAGNEPFRLGNYSFHRTGQIAQAIYTETIEPSMLLPTAQNNKSFSSGRGSRNFSSSSERYIVNQINKSRNGSRNSHLHHHHGSEVNQHYTSTDTCETGRGDHEQHTCIIPQDDDIEKSFRVNQDGSMTVEMKVHLTIKEEEMLHWTTTLSRSSLSKRRACASISESGNSSPDSNNAIAKESSSIEDETKEENHPMGVGKGVGFNNEQVYEGYTSTALGKAKSSFKRTPTPGPRHVKKKTSVESVKMVTESGVQESTLGHYSYMERTANGETTAEGYCIVRHSNSSSSSNRPIPKPRKTASADTNKKGFNTSIRSSGVAEVLKIQNHGMEVTETVMHINEGQGCYDNYFANEEYNTDGGPVAAPDSKPSTESGPRSSSNDCDIDFSCQPSTADRLQRQREEILSLSSEPSSPTRETVKEDKVPTTEKRNNEISKPNGNAKGSPSTCSSDKKLSPSRNSKHSSTDKLSNVSMGKKSLGSSESPKSGQNSKEAERKAGNPQSKKFIKASRKDSAFLVSNSKENMKKTPSQRQSINEVAARDYSHNVNTPSRRPQVKKNMSDIIQPKKSLLPGKKTISTPKSMVENRIASPKKSLELSESVSMPSLNLTPSQIHQYVENWLEKVSPDQASYTESIPDELEPRAKVVFQIGGDSESDETNECQSKLDECYTLSGVVKKSVSCLSVPLSHEGPQTTVLYNEQKPRGLCVSMPSVRMDSVHQENTLRPHKSAEAIGPQESESTSSISNILSPKAKIKPVLRQLCSSIQCIRSVSDSNTTSHLEKSNSLPDFSTQVASVFGSSCKAFLSFLSVMTLRDSITGSTEEDGNQSQSTSEAMLMMESLQKISVIEDEEEQRSSLTDLQSRASSEFRARWKDFQIMRERFESEPLSPKVSETEFALDVVSEGGDVFEGQIDELLEEWNMPQDLRAEISSTIHQARNFYPVDESTFIETDRNQSDSEEDVEKFVDEHNDDTKQSQGPVSTSIVQDVKEKKQDDDSGDDLNKMLSMYSEQEKIQSSEVSQTEREEALEIKDESEEKEEQLEEVEQDREEEREEEKKQINDYGEENIGNEIEEEKDDMAENEDDEGRGKWEAGKESGCESVVKVEKGTEGEMTKDMEELEREKEGDEETEEVIMEIEDAEKGGETDEREMAEEEEKEEIIPENSAEEEIEEGTEEGEKVEKTTGEDEKEVDIITDNDDEEEPEDVIEETEEEKDLENITDEVEEKEVKNSVEDEGDGDFEESEVADDFNVEVVEKEEEVNVLIENDVEEEKEEIIGDADDEKEKENNLDELEGEQEEEKEVDTEKDIEEEVEHVIGDTDEEEGVENMIDEVEEREGEVDGVTKKDEEEDVEEVTDETQGDEKDEGEINSEMEEKEEEEVDVAFENDAEEEIEGEEEETINHEVEDTDDDTDEVSEEGEEAEEIINETGEEEEAENINEEGEEEMVGEDCSEEESEDGDAEVRNTEEGRASVITNEDEEETDEDTDKEEKSNKESRKEFEKQSSLEVEEVEELETGENIRDGQTLDEEEREDDEENEQDEELEVEQQESNYDIIEEDDVTEDMDSSDNDVDSKNLLQEAFCLQQHCSSHEETNTGHITDSPTKYSSEGQCEYEKGNEANTADELEIDGGGQTHEDRSNSLPHPVEISQELLDFVNSALQSSSLTFTYDACGNIRIEPDNAKVVQTKQTIIPNHRNDSSYGLKRLPSPSTSDLTDYRPETSESGGYKSQDSLDIVTESGEEASEKPFPVCRHKIDTPDGKMDVEQAIAKVSVASNSEILQNSGLKSGESFSSYDSGSKVSREDLSYFSATSSSKADAEATQCMSLTAGKEEIDGVLIDQGRWLLKENHLIRKSPPVSLGMYGNLDSSSIDTGQENGSEELPPHYKTKQNPLVAISSSELEEMVKPQTLKCTYYNMPHGSDSDPFLDESSIQSGKKETNFVKGRGFRVSPTIDTSKTWSNKNGSLSSFASVEFKMPDSRVHPVGESSAVTQARRTPSGGGSALQAQDSLDTLRMRCGQYCPIL